MIVKKLNYLLVVLNLQSDLIEQYVKVKEDRSLDLKKK